MPIRMEGRPLAQGETGSLVARVRQTQARLPGLVHRIQLAAGIGSWAATAMTC